MLSRLTAQPPMDRGGNRWKLESAKAMKKLLVVLLVVVIVYVVVDLVVRSVVQDEVADLIQENVLDSEEVTVSIPSLPFVARVLVLGSVPTIDVVMQDVSGQGVHLERVDIDVEGLTVDRGAVFRGTIEVIDADRVEIVGTMSESAVSELVGTTVVFDEGQVLVDDGTGGLVAATIAVGEGTLFIEAPGIESLSVEIPDQTYLPCEPEVVVLSGVAEVGCVAHEIPDVVRPYLSGESTGGSDEPVDLIDPESMER